MLDKRLTKVLIAALLVFPPVLGVLLSARVIHAGIPMDEWQRHIIDTARPGQALFIDGGDLNGDGLPDIVTGSWWYQNPGSAGGAWTRHAIGGDLYNMAVVYDLDGDEDLDILGSRGELYSNQFAWAENNGDGTFVMHTNIPNAAGDFLQGAKVAQIEPGGNAEVVLSWHDYSGTQMFRVPTPATDGWSWGVLSPTTNGEQVAIGDIDRDGDLDIHLGTQWLRQDANGTWTAIEAFELGAGNAAPDRVELADINGDGRLDVVIGTEGAPRVVWAEAPPNPEDPWTEHVVSTDILAMSLDVGDLDQDGDIDIVVGEHNTSNPDVGRVIVYQNENNGASWGAETIDTGIEHHDGTQFIDIDADGDLDIVSIGWMHGKVVLYENLALSPGEPTAEPTPAPPTWTNLSSKSGDLPTPWTSRFQTASLVLDVDRDGVEDFVIGSRWEGDSLVWYRRGATGWTQYLIEDETLPIEAGGTFWDIDGDGDLDIVMGGDSGSNKVWWWENPEPNYGPQVTWVRREIKSGGSNKHHDQIFGDFDGDGRGELVFWNQGAKKLYLAEIPANPKATQPWPYSEIYSWSSGSEHEGLASADINGDGKEDIVGGGRWFEHQGGTSYTPHVIDNDQRFGRAAAGQLKEGGWPEVVFVPGDGVGRLKWYEWDGGQWVDHDLLGYDVDHGHSLQIEDINGDGYLDIFNAEMRLDGGNEDAKMWVFLGDGAGGFEKTEVATGYGNHESRIGDLDGDGDLDILGKPYNWDTPRVDVWLNSGDVPDTPVPGSPTPTPDMSSCEPSPSNVLTNPGFESGTDSWAFYNNGEGEFTATGPAYQCSLAARLAVTSTGSNMQFVQRGMPLKANTRYRLGFAAYATEGRDLEVYLHMHDAPWTNYGLSGFEFDLDDSWDSYEVEFTTTGFTGVADDGRLRFWLSDHAEDGDIYWLDDIVLEEVSTGPTSTPTPTPTPSGGNPPCETGSVLREWWTDLDGSYVVDLTGNARFPDEPSGSNYLAAFEGPLDWDDNYGARVRGYLVPPVSGSYTFWIAGDNQSELWLGSSAEPETSVLIASAPEWTGSREWNKYPTQQSAAISLQAGVPYYIEALHKEGWIRDNLAVAWQPPGSSVQVIDGEFLCPIDAAINPTPTPTLIPTETTTPVPTETPTPTPTTDLDPCAPSPSNVLANPGFEAGTASWQLQGDENGEFTTSEPAFQCTLAARVVATNVANDLQLYQTGILLKPETRYRLIFAGYSTAGQPVAVDLLKAGSRLTNYGLSGIEFSLNRSWSEYAIKFETTGFTDPVSDGRFQFRLVGEAQVGDELWLDDVVLEEIADTVVDTPTPTPGSPTDTPTPEPPTDTPTPTPTDTPTLTPTATNTPGSARVTEGLQVLYTFEEGSGTTVHDVSGVGAPLDLTIGNSGSVTWLADGLSVNSSSSIQSTGPATKVLDAVMASNEVTLEAWLRPANTTQDGPARIVTISGDTSNRNITLGQGLWGSSPSDLYNVRLRSTATDNNGTPSLSTSAGTLRVALTHVVYTRDASGVARIYLDGAEASSTTIGGALSNWNTGYRLALANEVTRDRPWLGDLELVAIYGRALSGSEVSQNYQAGPGGDGTVPPTPTPDPSQPTPTSTPQGGQAQELLVFDWNRPVAKSEHGFPRDYPPMASANGDWTQPVNFADGTLYYRAEVRSQPTLQNMRLQFCFWQYNFSLETCGSLKDVRGAPGTVVTWSDRIDDMWKKGGNPLDWANPRQTNGVAIKNSRNLPVSDYAGWNWNGENPDAWYPLDMRFTVVVVAEGASFSGWENYTNP